VDELGAASPVCGRFSGMVNGPCPRDDGLGLALERIGG
jgi:hypothetical protein